MKNPVIGITAGYDSNGDVFLRSQYVKAVSSAGGIPIVLTPTDSVSDILSLCGGLILSGGGDVLPERYGLTAYDRAKLFEPSAERDKFELELARLALGSVPILAICRGIQVLNVALGGTLNFDIPGHRQTLPRDEASHTVTVSDRRFSDIVGESVLSVNSFHHQSIGRIADGLKAAAAAPDGTVEAVLADFASFAVGVQWHPEHLNDAASKALFSALIHAAKSH